MAYFNSLWYSRENLDLLLLTQYKLLIDLSPTISPKPGSYLDNTDSHANKAAQQKSLWVQASWHDIYQSKWETSHLQRRSILDKKRVLYDCEGLCSKGRNAACHLRCQDRRGTTDDLGCLLPYRHALIASRVHRVSKLRSNYKFRSKHTKSNNVSNE